MSDELTAQSALDAWDDGDEVDVDSEASEADVERSDSKRGRSPFADPALSESAVVTDESCPFCLHPSDEFEERYRTDDDVVGELLREPTVSCPNCEAAIPVDAEWYQRGEKICVPV